ncbi:MAG: DUF5946 family protein [bacterium]
MGCSCGEKSQQTCHDFFEETVAKEFSDYRFGRIHRLTVDTYSLQHPQRYMISAKSFAAHLTGMCCAMEFADDPHLLKLLQHWLSGKKQLQKPPLLENVGSLTISHVVYAATGAEHIRLVREWAENVWQAYAVYHDLAKEWIAAARNQRQAKSRGVR